MDRKEEKKTLLQIIRKGNYQVFLVDVIKPNQLHFYSIYIAHTASNVQSLALNWEIQQPGSTPVPEVVFLGQALLNPPPPSRRIGKIALMCWGKQLKNIDLKIFPQSPAALEAQNCIKVNARIEM